jgi:hypothetical protein
MAPYKNNKYIFAHVIGSSVRIELDSRAVPGDSRYESVVVIGDY